MERFKIFVNVALFWKENKHDIKNGKLFTRSSIN